MVTTMVRAGAIVAILVLLMVPAMLASSGQSLQVHTADGTLVWCVNVKSNDTVQLQFTHSMFGGYVREDWRVTPSSELARSRFVTENAAAAEYYATDGSSYRADDGYVVPGAPLQQPELTIRVNNRGNHMLTTGDNSIHLAEALPQSTQVRVRIHPESC